MTARRSLGLAATPWIHPLVVLAMLGCGGTAAGGPDAARGHDASSDRPPTVVRCDAPTALLDLAVDGAGEGACATWIGSVRGRVLVNGPASAVVWTARTPSDVRLGVVLSAVHTLGSGWFLSDQVQSGQDVTPALAAPPPDTRGVNRLRVPAPDGTLDRRFVSPQWIVYRPAIPASQHEDVRTILPRHDVYVGLVDGHRAEEMLVAPPTPAFSERAPLTLHDPLGRTAETPIVSDPGPGTLVLLAGYPQTDHQDGAASVGRVLGDDEARSAIALLAARGDEEGGIAYAPEVEMLVEGRAVTGMSGGGAFDHDGRLLGVLVRASDPDAERQFVRVVRLRYVASLVAAARQRLDPPARTAVDRFLPASD